MNLWQRFTKFFEKIFKQEKLPELQEAQILEEEPKINQYFIKILSGFEKQKPELKLVPKVRFEVLPDPIRSYLQEQLYTFNSKIQGIEKFKNGTGYIGAEPFECYKRILADRYREGKTIVSSNRYIDIITTKGNLKSNECTYQEKTQENNGEKVELLVSQVDENIYKILQTRAFENRFLRESAEMATDPESANDFMEYAQPFKNEERKKAYCEVTKLPEINSMADLGKADFQEPFPYIICIEKGELGSGYRKTVKYLYDGQQSYAKEDKPYMIYLSRNRWTY